MGGGKERHKFSMEETFSSRKLKPVLALGSGSGILALSQQYPMCGQG